MTTVVENKTMQSVKEKLISLEKPKNQILARLQDKLKDFDDHNVSGYSRMHHKHNRS